MSTTPTTVLDSLGARVVACDGILYVLTECCQASATGTTYGTACRSCYSVLPEWAGWATLVAAEGAAESLAWLLGQAWGITQDPQGILDRLAGEAVERARALAEEVAA